MAKDEARKKRFTAVIKNSLFITPKVEKFPDIEFLNKELFNMSLYAIYLKIYFTDKKWRAEIAVQKIDIKDNQSPTKQIDKLIKIALDSVLEDENVQTIAPMTTVPEKYKKSLKFFTI